LGVLFIIILTLFSRGEFSVVFTLAGTVQTFGFGLIVYKITLTKSVRGLSKHTFLNYTLIFALRTFLYFIYRGYLPSDSSGDYIFKIQEILALIFSSYILYCIYLPYKSTYEKDLDIVQAHYLIIPCLTLAFFFHSNLNRSLFGDMSWAFTQYLEAVAVLGQFMIFSKKVSI
jgi:ER lumen protein retaining receptor